SARISSISNLSLILGGLLYIFVTSSQQKNVKSVAASTKFRYYSEGETRMLCGFLLTSCVANLVLTGFFPSREVKGSVSSDNPQDKMSLCHQFRAVGAALVD
ncbi:hypothetical protein PFISCL1PPCAC_11792, partial [Pristionchus fissidentatus]